MALYQASDFTGFSDSYAVPAGSGDDMFTGSVDLILSTGITQQVFDTLSTALNVYILWNNKNFIVYHLMKMLLLFISGLNFDLRNAYVNQKVMNSYVCTYHGNHAQAIHRSMADMVRLSEALASVGFRCIGLPWVTDRSPKMETDRADKDRPRIQVVDYVYTISNSTPYKFSRFPAYCDFKCLYILIN